MTRMARSAGTVGKVLRRCLLPWLIAFAVLSVPAIGYAAGAASLYAGPATDPAFTTIAPRLLTALYPDQRLSASSTPDSTKALEHVAADPSSAAVVDLAMMLAFAKANNLPADRLEFHGPVEQHCLLAFVRRDGWLHEVSDLA